MWKSSHASAVPSRATLPALSSLSRWGGAGGEKGEQGQAGRQAAGSCMGTRPLCCDPSPPAPPTKPPLLASPLPSPGRPLSPCWKSATSCLPQGCTHPPRCCAAPPTLSACSGAASSLSNSSLRRCSKVRMFEAGSKREASNKASGPLACVAVGVQLSGLPLFGSCCCKCPFVAVKWLGRVAVNALSSRSSWPARQSRCEAAGRGVTHYAATGKQVTHNCHVECAWWGP